MVETESAATTRRSTGSATGSNARNTISKSATEISRKNVSMNSLPPRSHSSIPTKYETIITQGGESEGFNSSSYRFNDSRTIVPGPGAYEVKSTQNPSHSAKGYGYGMVSKDKRWYDAPHKSFNPPGPGNYEPKVDVYGQNRVANSKGGTFQFMKASHQSLKDPYSTMRNDPRAEKLVPSTTPGPGSYNTGINNTTDIMRTSMQGTSSFKSSSHRFDSIDGKLEPILKPSSVLFRNTKSGPRANIKEKFVRHDETLPSAVFRSDVEKETTLIIKKQRPHPNASQQKIKRDGEKYEVRAKVLDMYAHTPSSSFASTGKLDRFGRPLLKKSKKNENTPGPGTYSGTISTSQPLLISSSFFMSNTERFGTTTAHDMYIAEKNVSMAPGSYDPPTSNRKTFHHNINASWV
jgi:hypothetical protein